MIFSSARRLFYAKSSAKEQMRQQLGLGPDDVGPGDDEDEAPPAPARRGGGGGAAGGAEKRVADLEAKNAELEKKLASEGTRRDEQVETDAAGPGAAAGEAQQQGEFAAALQNLEAAAQLQGNNAATLLIFEGKIAANLQILEVILLKATEAIPNIQEKEAWLDCREELLETRESIVHQMTRAQKTPARQDA
jgi:hypothetical protein